MRQTLAMHITFSNIAVHEIFYIFYAIAGPLMTCKTMHFVSFQGVRDNFPFRVKIGVRAWIRVRVKLLVDPLWFTETAKTMIN